MEVLYYYITGLIIVTVVVMGFLIYVEGTLKDKYKGDMEMDALLRIVETPTTLITFCVLYPVTVTIFIIFFAKYYKKFK